MNETKTYTIQVTNISPNITEDQIKHFLEYIGRIREFKLYPETDGDTNQTKVAYGRYDSPEHVEVALHLTNTVMVDRALILVPYPDETIPDETKALRVAAPMSTVAGMLPPTLEWPSNVVNMICGSGSAQHIHTIDPKLIELGLQQYPNLPGKTDPSKVEEIRRTIYVSNLDPTVNAEQLVQFFSQAGEVMFVRMAGDENLPSRNAYVEFSNQKSVPVALAYNGVLLNNRHLKVTHSLGPVANKPQTPGQEEIAKAIDEVMKKFKDIEHLIHGGSKSSSKRSGHSRSKSKERRRHKSKERRRSRERRRSPSPRKSSRRSSRPSSKKEGEESSKSAPAKERERKKRSRSRERKRSKSKERRRSRERKRSRSKERKRSRSKEKKRSRSRDKRRSRSRERKRSRSRDRRRDRDRSRDRRRRSRSRDRSRRSRSRDRKSRGKRSSSRDRDRRKRRDDKIEDKDKNGVKVKRDYDAEEKDMDVGATTKPVEENGEQAEEQIEKTNGEASDLIASDPETDPQINDISASSSKAKDAMADLEKQADTEAMDMDTGDDSETGV
ncbi:probable splicing factor, arginine/serine-rich 7 [Watersipora subatra]|uniref:probable splicing factor, arginine/serine-rich 7 n=1 Tax=Watersipora subatra TaxID=2589382 RepID=UPI00355C29A2